jgi:hypothetical protein
MVARAHDDAAVHRVSSNSRLGRAGPLTVQHISIDEPVYDADDEADGTEHECEQRTVAARRIEEHCEDQRSDERRAERDSPKDEAPPKYGNSSFLVTSP